MSDLYDADILEWSTRQAALLRRAAAGELVNADLDWPNIAEEIESVGNEQVHAVRSLLTQALLHDLKCKAWPMSREAPHWRSEALRFRIDASDRCTPSMRRRLDIAKLYARALRLLPDSIDDTAPIPVPQTCPVTLDELLGEE